MSKIEMILSKERGKLLSLNKQESSYNYVKNLIEDVWLFICDIWKGIINEKELEWNYLTKTIILIWKLEKIHDVVLSKKLWQIIIPVDFNIIDYKEFTEYYNFLEIQTNEWITAIMWDTTSLFNKLHKSNNFIWAYLLHQEAYEHEDDTDDSNYYIIFKWQ